MRRALRLGLVLVLPAAAAADEVFTRSGGHLTGEIVERGPRSLVIEIDIGRVELPLSFVDRIVPGAVPLTTYRQRAQALAEGDLAGWLALGRWAQDHDLPVQAEQAFAHVALRDPDNAAAQQALGRVKLDGEWMTREESYAARGLVPFEGGWVTAEEREARLAERAEAFRRAREEADEQARLRETEARLREAEAQARMAEAQARAMEAEARAAEVRISAFPPATSFVDGHVPPPGIVFQPSFPYVFGGRCGRPGPSVFGHRGGMRRSPWRSRFAPRWRSGRSMPRRAGGRR